MYIFNVISLLGGLAMFLYGMRLMSGSLKENSSGTLKKAIEKMTSNPIMAFLLGVAFTAIIQSSTATIVIVSGLVAAGILKLKQSLGIVIGANVGTTVTGQIIRLLDVDSSSTAWLQVFKPSTLAPIALIIGIILIMFCTFSKSDTIGKICMGFGILFSGLLNMTGAVEDLSSSGIINEILTSLGSSPFLGYVTGAGIAFVLQSSSATIGILQAFSVTGDITFNMVYVMLVGIYLGDCVTTAIVCSIGQKADARRVGCVNILFNLCETVLVLIVVGILKACGVLDGIWNKAMTSGDIANVNTIFNLGCAILLLPLVGVYEKASIVLVKDKQKSVGKYADVVDGLNSSLFNSPALAFNSAYVTLKAMVNGSKENINRALDLTREYKESVFKEVVQEEDNIDMLTDKLTNYLTMFSPYVKTKDYTRILDQYYKLTTEFERLSDHALNIAEEAQRVVREGSVFSQRAVAEIDVVRELINKILDYAILAFEKRNLEAARKIEPLEEVMDDLCNALHDNHLIRLRDGGCSVHAGACFIEILSNIERISDICSNVGVAVVARINPSVGNLAHSYISSLHQGNDEKFNNEYKEAHEIYFNMIEKCGEIK